MLHIVGGVYRENCHEGDWQQLFGSGLRAAAALTNLCDGVDLSTYVAAADQRLLDVASKTFGVRTHVTVIPRTIEFRYRHALAVPTIVPHLGTFETAQPIHVDAENVLQFGFIEGDAIVTGNRVVYDPQSAYKPSAFGANGSKAQSLAIVCNSREASLMSGEADLVQAGHALLAVDEADVVVIKRGSKGALVFHEGAVFSVPPCRTDRVWPLGSGDVFAAIFAFCWGQHRHSPVDAAQFASVATAHYCNSRVLPIHELSATYAGYSPKASAFSEEADVDSAPLVYLAGPFFNIMERWLVNELRDALSDQGLRVFSPYHNIGPGSADAVVPQDVEAIKKSDGMLAILDNLDSGTLFEVGYARALNKPVIGFAQNTTEESLKMLQGTNCCICDDLVTAVYQTVWSVQH